MWTKAVCLFCAQAQTSSPQLSGAGNANLATHIQARLTAPAKSMDNNGPVSPTFLAALEAVGGDPNESASQSALAQRRTTTNIYKSSDPKAKQVAQQDSAAEVRPACCFFAV